jgi:Tol biopolymer transport system component
VTPTTQPVTSFGSELLFLRGGALIALDIATHAERQLADGMRDFVAAPDGRTIALIRGEGGDTEIWTVRRDGGGLARLTSNQRVEAGMSWAPDGATLAYSSSTPDTAYKPEWMPWSQWCANSEVHLFTLGGSETSLGRGCDPAISPDGRRVAFATPPNSAQEGPPLRGFQNAIRLVNRQGQNGWNFAEADGGATGYTGKSGLLVYAPAWTPDGARIVYHRFIGYRALVDLDVSEIGGSFQGKGQPLHSGAGWLLPARFAPNGGQAAITENNFSDARGFGGYDNWKVTVLALAGSHEIALPEATLQAVGQVAGTLPRGQHAAGAPDGSALAVELPPGWNPELSPNEPLDAGENPGEIWRWRPGNQPEEKLAENVDFASPLAWLPPSSQ